MDKGDLAAIIACRFDTTLKRGNLAIDAVLSSIIKSLETGEPVKLRGFGTFEVRSVNGVWRVFFRASSKLKRAIRRS